jgi:hypothetical protein
MAPSGEASCSYCWATLRAAVLCLVGAISVMWVGAVERLVPAFEVLAGRPIAAEEF